MCKIHEHGGFTLTQSLNYVAVFAIAWISVGE